MKDEFLEIEERRKLIVADLKSRSPYFPEVLLCSIPITITYYHPKRQLEPIVEVINIEQFVSTIVRINRGGTWYAVHALEVASLSPDGGSISDMAAILTRLNMSAYQCQVLYQLTGNPQFEEVDKIQISEEERLKKMIKG